jgi:hypothetical protein
MKRPRKDFDHGIVLEYALYGMLAAMALGRLLLEGIGYYLQGGYPPIP